MLILTRKVLEEIMIGDDITIKIIGVQGRYVRIGVKAPKKISVHRTEVYDRIQVEGERREKGEG